MAAKDKATERNYETTEWIDIIPNSAQDEVCEELWQITQALKNRALVVIADAPHDGRGEGFTQELDDLIFLTSRAGDSYRYHAEKLPKYHGLMELMATANAVIGTAETPANSGEPARVKLT